MGRGDRGSISRGAGSHSSSQDFDEDRSTNPVNIPKRQRAKRPGQAPPMAPIDEEHEDVGAMHVDYEQEDVGGVRRKEENQYKERSTREHERWEKERAESTRRAVFDLPLVLASKRRQADEFIMNLQEKINQSWIFHPCCCEKRDDQSIKSFDGSCLSIMAPRPNEKRTTMYYGHQFSGPSCTLDLPLWYCNQCKETVKPHPLTYGCWPSTPHTPTFWIDVDVLEQYRMLGPAPKAGASARVFVVSIERTHFRSGLIAKEDMQPHPWSSERQARLMRTRSRGLPKQLQTSRELATCVSLNDGRRGANSSRRAWCA